MDAVKCITGNQRRELVRVPKSLRYFVTSSSRQNQDTMSETLKNAELQRINRHTQHSCFCCPVSKHVTADSAQFPWQATMRRQLAYSLLQNISKGKHSHPRVSVSQNTWGKTTVYDVQALASVSLVIRPVDQHWIQRAIEKSVNFTTFSTNIMRLSYSASPKPSETSDTLWYRGTENCPTSYRGK